MRDARTNPRFLPIGERRNVSRARRDSRNSKLVRLVRTARAEFECTSDEPRHGPLVVAEWKQIV